MEKIREYAQCFAGGVFAGTGCFYFGERLTKAEMNIIYVFLYVLSAVMLIYIGCVLALPKKESRLDILKFVLFSAGILCTGVFCI